MKSMFNSNRGSIYIYIIYIYITHMGCVCHVTSSLFFGSAELAAQPEKCQVDESAPKAGDSVFSSEPPRDPRTGDEHDPVALETDEEQLNCCLFMLFQHDFVVGGVQLVGLGGGRPDCHGLLPELCPAARREQCRGMLAAALMTDSRSSTGFDRQPVRPPNSGPGPMTTVAHRTNS